VSPGHDLSVFTERANSVYDKHNSFDGWMSLKFATVFPDHVTKLVLVVRVWKSFNKMAYELKDIPDDSSYYGALINNCGHESITP